MVTDTCWKRAGMKPRGGMLCIGCLEKRLGKKLTPRNFSECPLNWRNAILPDYASSRLVSRLYHGAEKSRWAKGTLKALAAAAKGNTKLIESMTLVSFGDTDGGG